MNHKDKDSQSFPGLPCRLDSNIKEGSQRNQSLLYFSQQPSLAFYCMIFLTSSLAKPDMLSFDSCK